MRWTLLLALGGCSLYFGPGPGGHDDGIGSDAGMSPSQPDAPLPLCQLYFCRDGTIYKLDPVPVNPNLLGCQDPDYSTAVPISSCQYGCRYENLYQGGAGPCAPAPPPVYHCEQTGTCFLNQTQACSAPMQCGQVVQTGSCSCTESGWNCQSACSDGYCSPEELQAAIVGTWHGVVTTPFDFMPMYETTLTIAANGDWSATGSAFYYGGNGGTNGSKIIVQAQTALGGYGVVRLFLASVDGMFTAMHVDATHLRFTFVDSWLSCGRSFSFDLVRQ